MTPEEKVIFALVASTVLMVAMAINSLQPRSLDEVLKQRAEKEGRTR